MFIKNLLSPSSSYCFFAPAVGGSTLAVKKRMVLLEGLVSQDDGVFQKSWQEFCFDVAKMVALRAELRDPETASSVLTAGCRYQGQGWCTSRASRALYETTGTALVTSSFDDYKHCFLFGLAIFLGVEVPTFDLSDKQAEAAYALASHAEHVQGGMQVDERPPVASGGVSLGAPPAGAEEREEEEDEPSFGWEEPTVDTPKELLEDWRRAEEGEHRIEVKRLLEKFPHLRGLPQRAPDNNMRGDHKKREDKFLKVMQQNVLNILRISAHQLATPEPQVALQLWQYCAELYFKVLQERKEMSLPGCTKEQQGLLFSKEDVQQVKAEQSINSIRMQMGGKSFPSLGSAFRPSGGSGGFRGGFKGGFRGGFKGFKSYGPRSARGNCSWRGGKGWIKPFKGLPSSMARRQQHTTLLHAKAATAILGATPDVMELIAQGVHHDWPCPALPFVPQVRSN